MYRQRNIKIRPFWFNIYLLLLGLALLTGCGTSGGKDSKKKDKKATMLRVHLEMNPDGTDYVTTVPVYREKPILISIFRTPVLNEGDIESAQVVDVRGGFAIRLELDRHGALALETATVSNRGRRLAIYAQFGDARWLAAPLIRQRLHTGELIFTPDATREEAERIVEGLNNVSAELRNKKKKKK